MIALHPFVIRLIRPPPRDGPGSFIALLNLESLVSTAAENRARRTRIRRPVSLRCYPRNVGYRTNVFQSESPKPVPTDLGLVRVQMVPAKCLKTRVISDRPRQA